MKVFGKYLVVQHREGKKAIVTWNNRKKDLVDYMNENAKQICANTWEQGDSIFTIEKNTKEYKF